MTSKKLQFKLSFYQLTYFLQREFIPTQHNTPEDKYRYQISIGAGKNSSIEFDTEVCWKFAVFFTAKKETQVPEH